jgi:P27 family predicted phage terminase small subunit
VTESSGAGKGRRSVKPTALKVLHGDFKQHPSRRNLNEPAVESGEIKAPDGMSPQARVMWDYLAPILIRAKILTASDVPMLAEFCEATVIVRLARIQVMKVATGAQEIPPGAASPYASYMRSINVMTNLGGRLGLSPSDRSRLIVLPADAANRDELLSG